VVTARVLFVSIAAVLAVVTPAAAQEPNAMEWTAPEFTAFANSRIPGINGFSCATNDFCAVLANTGGLAGSTGAWTTTTPTQPDSWTGPGSWEYLDDGSGRSLSVLECPSAALCVTGGAGQGIGSGRSGPVDFKFEPVFPSNPGPDGNAITRVGDIACPAVDLCLALAATGNGALLATTTNPRGPAGDWTLSPVPGIMDVGCASRDLCWRAYLDGRVEVSSSPAMGLWTPVGTGGPGAVPICATPSVCVAARAAGAVRVSTDPADPASWRQRQVTDGDELAYFDCAAPATCVATTATGVAWASLHSDTDTRWHPSRPTTAV
jgi:hypothetical protein